MIATATELEQIMAEDAAADRPFIAAMVVSKARRGLRAPGFFDCAARRGRFVGDATGPDARVFHAVELNAVLALWAPTSLAQPPASRSSPPKSSRSPPSARARP